MTQKAIKEQFRPGDKWRVVRSGGKWPNPCDEMRTVVRVQGRCLVTLRENGKEIDTDWPWRNGSQIIKADFGYFEFMYADDGPTIRLTRLTAV